MSQNTVYSLTERSKSMLEAITIIFDIAEIILWSVIAVMAYKNLHK